MLKFLGKFERYPTITKETTNTVTKIFIALFANTALVTLIIHGNIFGFIPAIEITYPIPSLYDSQSE